MCRHDFVTVYQDGGTCQVCRLCSLSTEWKASGKAGIYLGVSAALAVFPAFIAWLVIRPHYGQAIADIGALFTWLMATGVCLWLFCACALAQEPDHDGEVE